MGMDIDQQIRKRFELVAPVLDERRLRLYVAAEALALGYGGISLVSRATGISRPTITWGCQELSAAKAPPHYRTLLAAFAHLEEGASARPPRIKPFAVIWKV